MTLDLTASAHVQIDWLQSGKTTSIELLDAYAAQYQERNPPLNAIVATDIQGARRQAADFDKRRAAGEDVGPLAGLPMTVKDVFDVKGLPAICGVPALKERSPDVEDAVTVARLKAAGAIIWAKTNTPMFAGDGQTYNKVYGVTNNPHDPGRSPGGSSGGAAAALASAMTPLELGSDIGGSLRNPAHSCGVCALKPSWGLIPQKGHVPPSPDIDAPDVDLAVVGPMARCVDDLALMLPILAPDARKNSAPVALSEICVAIADQPHFHLGEVMARAMENIRLISQKANAITRADWPLVDPIDLMETYQRLLIPIVTAELPAPIRGMFRIVSPVAKLMRKRGEFSLSNMIHHAVQSKAQIAAVEETRDHMKAKCEEFFDTYDVLIAPVLPTPALAHNNKGSLYGRKISIDGMQAPYTSIFEWIALASLCHLPAAVIPVGSSPDGLPIGLQFIGREGEDHRILAIARSFENELKRVFKKDI